MALVDRNGTLADQAWQRPRRPDRGAAASNTERHAQVVQAAGAGAKPRARHRPLPHRPRIHRGRRRWRARSNTCGRVSSPARSPSFKPLVKHQGTGWDFAIDELRRYYERVSARVKRADGSDAQDGRELHERRDGAEGPPPFFAALEQWYLTGATNLGRRTAELHAALTGEPGSPFAPEPLDRDALGALANQMRAHGDAALDLLAARALSLDEVSRGKAEEILAERDALLSRFDAIRGLDDCRNAHQGPRRLSPGPGAAHRGRLRHPRLRGRSRAVDRGASHQAVSAEGRRRDDPVVRLRRIRGAVRLRGARARR